MAIFARLVDDMQDGFETRYATFICSLIEPTFNWHYQELVNTKKLSSMMICTEEFDTLIELFKEGCKRIKIPMHIMTDLVAVIETKKS